MESFHDFKFWCFFLSMPRASNKAHVDGLSSSSGLYKLRTTYLTSFQPYWSYNSIRIKFLGRAVQQLRLVRTTIGLSKNSLAIQMSNSF